MIILSYPLNLEPFNEVLSRRGISFIKLSSKKGKGKPLLAFNHNIETLKNGCIIRFSLENKGMVPVCLEEIICLEAGFSEPFLKSYPYKEWKVLRDGKETGCPYYLFSLNERKEIKSTMCSVIKCGKETVVIGFISTAHFPINITVKKTGNGVTFMAVCEGEDKPVLPGQIVPLESLYIGWGNDPFDEINRYALLVKKEMNVVLPYGNKIPTGWGDYDYYRSKSNEDEVVKNVEYLSRNRGKFPVEYIQIDASYVVESREDTRQWPCKMIWGDWLETNERFPHGMKWLAERIKEKGFKPGIWVGPYAASRNSKLFKEHTDWFLRNKAGELINIYYGEGMFDLFVLDGSHPSVLRWFEDVFKTITQDWGYKYLKLDFLQWGLIKGAGYDKNLTSVERYRIGLEAMKKGAGEAYLLGCGAPHPASIGLFDGMRIGGDMSPSWGEEEIISGGLRQCCYTNAPRYYMHKNFWINDTDYLGVRGKEDIDSTCGYPGKLSFSEAELLTNFVYLSGGAVILSDKLEALSKERTKLLTRVLPPQGNPAIPSDLFEKEDSLCEFYLSIQGEDKCLLGILNWEKEKREYKINGFGKACLIKDLWEDRFYKFRNGTLKITLPPHSSKILKIEGEDIKHLRRKLRFKSPPLKRKKIVDRDFVLNGEPFYINLKRYANREFLSTLDELARRHSGEELTGISPFPPTFPIGESKFLGIPFKTIKPTLNDKNVCIVLQGHPSLPERIEGIPINRSVKSLYFLHTTGWSPDTNRECFKYVVRYANGDAVTIPVREGIEIGYWHTPERCKEARIAWVVKNAFDNHPLACVYVYCWNNTFPLKKVRSLDIVSAKIHAIPTIIAITGILGENRK